MSEQPVEPVEEYAVYDDTYREDLLDHSEDVVEPSVEEPPERFQYVDPQSNQLYWLTAEELAEKNGS